MEWNGDNPLMLQYCRTHWVIGSSLHTWQTLLWDIDVCVVSSKGRSRHCTAKSLDA